MLLKRVQKLIVYHIAGNYTLFSSMFVYLHFTYYERFLTFIHSIFREQFSTISAYIMLRIMFKSRTVHMIALYLHFLMYFFKTTYQNYYIFKSSTSGIGVAPSTLVYYYSKANDQLT